MLSSQASAETPSQSLMQVSMLPVVNSAAASRPVTMLRGPAVTMATVEIPQMRVLHTSKPGQTHHFQHPVQTHPTQQLHQIQILKAIPSGRGGEILVPTTFSAVAGAKTTFASPGKGPTVCTIPRSKVLSGGTVAATLKVGDTIVIPAKTLNTFNPTSRVDTQSIVIKNEPIMNAPGQLVFSTPTKFMPATKSPLIGSPATPQQSALVRTPISHQPSTPLSNSLCSPVRLTTISPSSWTPSPMRSKRPVEFAEQDSFSDSMKKSRRVLSAHDKGSKGLRHFAMLVCEKVKQKITTTYNEVADELVSEYSSSQRHLNDQQYDQKNIRRRVYDALNVLMAMNIIYKDKKDIHWVGLPTNSAQELQSLQSEKQKREQRIKQKTAQLHELILQQIAFKNLVQRNKRLQQAQGPPASNSAIQLPFIIVNTSKKTVIDCSISNDKYEYLFNFDNTFEIHDDIEVLKRMGMAYGLENGTCSKEDLRVAQSLVPPVLRPYLEEMAGHKQPESSDGPSTSASSSQAMCSGHGSQSSTGSSEVHMSHSPFDGHQLLSSIKPDPDDEVSLMIAESEESQSSTKSMTASGPSSFSAQSSPIDVLNILQQSVPTTSSGFDFSCLNPSSLHNFDR